MRNLLLLCEIFLADIQIEAGVDYLILTGRFVPPDIILGLAEERNWWYVIKN